MTYLAPDATPLSFISRLRHPASVKGLRHARRIGIADEDGARKAMGADHGVPVAALAGASLESLARVALG